MIPFSPGGGADAVARPLVPLMTETPIFFDADLAHSSMVMSNCATGFAATLATYAGLATWDDRNKRKDGQ